MTTSNGPWKQRMMFFSIDPVPKLRLMMKFSSVHMITYGICFKTFFCQSFVKSFSAMHKWSLVGGNQMLFFYVRKGFEMLLLCANSDHVAYNPKLRATSVYQMEVAPIKNRQLVIFARRTVFVREALTIVMASALEIRKQRWKNASARRDSVAITVRKRPRFSRCSIITILSASL